MSVPHSVPLSVPQTHALIQLKSLMLKISPDKETKTMRTDEVYNWVAEVVPKLYTVESILPPSTFLSMRSEIERVLVLCAQSNPRELASVLHDMETTFVHLQSEGGCGSAIHDSFQQEIAYVSNKFKEVQAIFAEETNVDLVAGIVNCLMLLAELIVKVCAYDSVSPQRRLQFIIDISRFFFYMTPFVLAWRFFQTMIACWIPTVEQMEEMLRNMRTTGTRKVLILFCGKNLLSLLMKMFDRDMTIVACDINFFETQFAKSEVSDASDFLKRTLSNGGICDVIISWAPASFHQKGKDSPDYDVLKVVLAMRDRVSCVVMVGDDGITVGTNRAYALLKGSKFHVKSNIWSETLGVKRKPHDYMTIAAVIQD